MLALKIAMRYLVSPKSHKVVNVISFISLAGVAVATMAIMVVLSVFNGFSDLAASHLALCDPDIKIISTSGKVFGNADSLVHAVEAMPQVQAAAPVLQERGLLSTATRQIPVRFKGVDHAKAGEISDMERLIIDGTFAGNNGMPDSIAGTQIAVGIALSTGLRPSTEPAAELIVPRRKGRINPANPAGAYKILPLAVSGVIQVDQPEYDTDFMLIPLDRALSLLDYPAGTASAVEIRLKSSEDADAFLPQLNKALPDGLCALSRMEQQADTFKMISIEKWVTFLMLVFILLIASFNIVSTLSLMVIEKQHDMRTLRALGAPAALVSNIFISLGWLITAIGGLAGTILGVILSLLQEHLGLIKLNGDPSALSIEVYPVRVEWSDIALVFGAVLVTGLLISQISRIFSRKIK